MKVVILCGGKGTRIREETGTKPKPMVEIGGRPILWHIMKIYASYGHTDFVLCLGYKQHVVRDYFLNYEHMSNDITVHLRSHRIETHSSHNDDWTVTLVDTGEETKKGTRLKAVQRYLGHERFMLTYGDGVADVDLHRLVQHHEQSGKVVTFTGIHPTSRFATVDLDPRGRVRSWEEKRQLEGYVNAGFFVLEPRIFDYIEGDCELEMEPMERLTREGQVNMYPHEGFWHCMDTYRDYEALSDLWRSPKPPWKHWQD